VSSAAGPALSTARLGIYWSTLSKPTSFQTTRCFASKKKKMPPKKQEAPVRIPLGRPGNNLKSGIVCRALDRNVSCSPEPQLTRLQVGLANVGKSTLFQAITKCSLGNPAVSRVIQDSPACSKCSCISELPIRDHRPRGGSCRRTRRAVRLALRAVQAQIDCARQPYSLRHRWSNPWCIHRCRSRQRFLVPHPCRRCHLPGGSVL